MCDLSRRSRLQLRFNVLGIVILLLSSLPVFSQTPTSLAVTPQNPVAKVGDLQQFSSISNDGTKFALAQVKQIAAGGGLNCALMANGTVQCWGFRVNGELGNSSAPVIVSGLSGVTSIAAGMFHTCALLGDGTAQCWGYNGDGALGNGTTTTYIYTPVPVTGLSGVTAIAAGTNHTCALLGDGTVECWGYNGVGELGDGTLQDSPVPVVVAGLGGVSAIATGEYHTCALLGSGAVKCWGRNVYGTLGDGTTADSRIPVAVTGLSGAKAISAGMNHNCALLKDGTVQCWGRNQYGELGNGTPSTSAPYGIPTPVAVSSLSGVTAISAGGYHTCALLGDGAVECWGYNGFGEIGNGTTEASAVLTPVAVSTVRGATSIAAAVYETCALVGNGEVQCWGDNSVGQLGTGSSTSTSPLPVTIVAASGGAAMPSSGALRIGGGLYHSCAVLSNGTVDCWGASQYGQLGNGTNANSSTPAPVSGVSDVTSVMSAGTHTCALLSNGTVECWGDNSYGQLGNGSTTNSLSPVQVSGLSGVTAISHGTYHTCALLSNGTVQCWGDNRFGQLGAGAATSSPTPVVVSAVSGAAAIAVGDIYTCALLSNGRVVCWGDNRFGQLGDGTTTSSPTPVMVIGLNGAKAIASGYEYMCALLTNGTVECWGWGEYGQLGNGTATSSLIPVPVIGLSGVTAIAAAYTHACALLSDGMVKCWGDNDVGQLGNDGPLYSLTPIQVSGLSGVKTIAAGFYHTCSVLPNGTVKCWGYNSSGQLGDGTTTSSATPVPTGPLATSVSWSSSDPTVAMIDPVTGNANAVSEGTATISATYGSLAASTTLTVGTPPSISHTQNDYFAEGYPGITLKVMSTGVPTPVLSISGTLPTGLAFDPATGVLGGTPADGTIGNYTVTFTASNGLPPDATWDYSFRVKGNSSTVWPWGELAQGIGTITYGSAVVGDATASYKGTAIPGTFVYDPPVGTILQVDSSQRVHVDFTPLDTDRYIPSGEVAWINVTPAASAVTLNCPASVVYNNQPQTPCAATATGAGGLSVPVTITYTNNNAIGTATATATYAGDANHTGSSASRTFSITGTGPKTPMPTITPGFGYFSTPTQVKLSDSLVGASIYYTTDGSTPTTNSNLYSVPFTITSTTTVKAMAVANGYTPSNVNSVTLTFVVPTPSITPGFGSFSAPTSVTLKDSMLDATIYYSTDGSTPTVNSKMYTAPFTITGTTTIKAMAVKAGWSQSAVNNVTLSFVTPTPSITPGFGTFSTTTPQTITMKDSMDSNIYYTLDGTTPTVNSLLYTGPFTISATTTIKAMAIAKVGVYNQSAINTATLTFK